MQKARLGWGTESHAITERDKFDRATCLKNKAAAEKAAVAAKAKKEKQQKQTEQQ